MGFSLNPLDDLSSALHTGEKIIGDGATDFKKAMGDAAKVVTHMSPSEIGHTVLNVAGMVPVIGAPADAINAGWYAAQGDWGNAALSAATAIPGLGDVVGGARLGANALKIAEDGVRAERVLKDGTEVAKTAERTIADISKTEKETSAVGRTAEISAASSSTVDRVNELKDAIPDAQKGRITMAVGRATDSSGAEKVLVATSEPGGYLRPGVTLKPGEILAAGGKHAEVDIVNFAKQNGLTLLEVGATRPICGTCASAIEEAGAKAVTALKAH
jgi:filamentous hemagglutinin